MNTVTAAGLARAAALTSRANRILVLSGAGLSQGSGIPTYRDIGGMWEIEDNLKFATLESYRANPKAFAKFWVAHRRVLSRSRPNAAHWALRQLQDSHPNVTMVTQNVDGLLSGAGCQHVHELHGNLYRERCDHCAHPTFVLFNHCMSCFSWTRPDVVLFGEALPEATLNAANEAARNCDLIMVIGTSAVVYPAAQLPVTALRAGASLIVIDAAPPLLAHAADVVLTGPAEELIPELVTQTLALDRLAAAQALSA